MMPYANSSESLKARWGITEVMNRPTRFFSDKQEKKVAKQVGGKQTVNSGATKFFKGDIVLDNWILECKTTTEFRKTFTLHKEWFDKNKEEAFAMHKDYSAVVIDFGDGEQHYIIDEKLFKKLLNYLKEEYECEDKDRQS